MLLTLLETLAEQQPVVLVVEDVHWADRSTCDLLSFLVRNIRQARVLLVVTFRSDELNRNDLLRPLLAGLARAEGVHACSWPGCPAPRPRCSSRASWAGRRPPR